MFVPCMVNINFHSSTVHLGIITSLFIQLNAQLYCSRKMLKLTLKCSYMFWFNKPSSVNCCCALLKL